MDIQQLKTWVSNERAAMTRKIMEDVQAENKIAMEEFEKRKAQLIKGERRLVEEKEALRSESVALERTEKELKARATVLEQNETKIAIEEQRLAKEKRSIASEKMELAKEKNKIASEKEDFAQEKDKIASEKERLAKEKREIASEKLDFAKEKDKITSEKARLAQEKREIASAKADLAKEKREIASEKTDLAKEKTEIASEKQALREETTTLANKTRDERQLLKDKEVKLNGRDAELKEGRRTLSAQQQQLIEDREDLERRIKIGDLDIKCKYNTLEKDKEKFQKWKAEEESAMQKQKEHITLQQNMSAKPSEIEKLASRGWMSIEDFLGDVTGLKSTLKVSQSTISSMKHLLDHMQSRQKIVDGLIKLDQNATWITIAENGSTTPLFCEGSPNGLDSTLRKLYNSILIKARMTAAGGTSLTSSSWSQSQGTV